MQHVAAGTLVGCMPNNFVAVNAGNKLSELQSLRELYDAKHLLMGESTAPPCMHVTLLHANANMTSPMHLLRMHMIG